MLDKIHELSSLNLSHVNVVLEKQKSNAFGQWSIQHDVSSRERLLTRVSSFCEKELQKSSALIPPTRPNRNFEDGGLVLMANLQLLHRVQDSSWNKKSVDALEPFSQKQTFWASKKLWKKKI